MFVRDWAQGSVSRADCGSPCRECRLAAAAGSIVPSQANSRGAPMEPGEFRYWAFISYSHHDARIAATQQRALETYRLPKRLIGRPTPLGAVPRVPEARLPRPRGTAGRRRPRRDRARGPGAQPVPDRRVLARGGAVGVGRARDRRVQEAARRRARAGAHRRGRAFRERDSRPRSRGVLSGSAALRARAGRPPGRGAARADGGRPAPEARRPAAGDAQARGGHAGRRRRRGRARAPRRPAAHPAHGDGLRGLGRGHGRDGGPDGDGGARPHRGAEPARAGRGSPRVHARRPAQEARSGRAAGRARRRRREGARLLREPGRRPAGRDGARPPLARVAPHRRDPRAAREPGRGPRGVPERGRHDGAAAGALAGGRQAHLRPRAERLLGRLHRLAPRAGGGGRKGVPAVSRPGAATGPHSMPPTPTGSWRPPTRARTSASCSSTAIAWRTP